MHGIPKIVEQREDFPFVAVSPQCPSGSWWWRELDALTGLLDEVVGTLVDTNRIYQTAAYNTPELYTWFLGHSR